MSTPYPDGTLQDGLSSPSGKDTRFPAGGATPDAGAGPDQSLEELALEAAAFSGAFERWANHKAIQAGATTPRLRLLYSVHCHGPQKMADLAETLTVTPRNITALVDALEAEGLVRRVPHTTDRRVTMVELTCAADLVESQFQTYQASIAGLFADLDETDRRTLQRLFRTLHDRIHADADCAAEVATDA